MHLMWLFVCLLYHISHVHSTLCPEQDNTKVVFATSIILGGEGASKKDIIDSQQIAIKMFYDTLRNFYGVNVMNDSFELETKSEKVPIEMWFRQDYADKNIAKNNTIIFCKNPSVRFIFTTGLGDVSAPSLEYIEESCHNIIAVAGNGLSKHWSEKKKRTFSIPPVPENRLDPILPFLRYNNIKNVATIYPDYPFYIPLCQGIDDKKQKNYNFVVVNSTKIGYSASDPLPYDITTQVHKAVDDSYNEGAEAILLCGTDPYAREMMTYIKKKEYNFKLLSLTPTKPTIKSIDPDLKDYWVFMDDYIPEIPYGKDMWYNNSGDFTNYVMKHYTNNSIPSPHVYRMLYTYLLAVHTLINSDSVCYSDLLFTIERTNLDMIVGRILFDGFHSSTLTPVVTQVINNITYIVSPPEYANHPLIVAPNWTERYYIDEFGTEEYLFFGIASAFILFSIVSAIIIIVFRKNDIVHAAAPTFMLGLLIGSIFIYTSIFFDRIHKLSEFTCIFRVWLLGLGFFIMFGCLFAKSFRVYRLWTANLSKPAVVTSDLYLAVMVGIITSVEIVFLIIYSAASKVKVVENKLEEFKLALNEKYCSFDGIAGIVILSIMVIYGFLLMIFGLFLAWRTRKVPYLAFNESKIILFSMYNVGFFTLLDLLITVNSEKIPTKTLFILRSICVLLAAFITVLITVSNKFWLMMKGKKTKSKISMKANQPSKGPDESDSCNDEDTVPRSKYLALKDEYEKLKKLTQITGATVTTRIESAVST